MIKKDKVYELKIEEDDDISGIDSISLVDEPAIEINWMYFSKEKPHEFHIPDGEDNKYLEKLVSIAQNEQDLFDEGWVVSKITPFGKEDFITAPDPNGPSSENEKEYRVRYKYVLNPAAGTNPIIPTTRDFCRELIQKNYVWRLEDMDALTNDEGDSALVWRGGYNCRHLWARIEYTLDSTIRNKASVNTGKIDPQAPLDTRVLGLEQPSTVVPAWPSFSKVNMESVSDYPDSVKNNAKAVLKYVDENGWGSCGTSVGKIRASQLANGEPISEDTVRRMYSYLSRHKVDLDSSKSYDDGCGKLMYDSWGGLSALSWAESKVNSFKKEMKDDGPCWEGYEQIGTKMLDGREVPNCVPIKKENMEVGVPHYTEDGKLYEGPTHKDADGRLMTGEVHTEDSVYLYHEDELGYDVGTIGGYEDPNIKKKKKKDQKFAIDSEEKRTIVGPAMVPDLKIPRKDNEGNRYEVYFSSETIKMIADKYMKNQYTRNNDLMHDGTAVKDVYVVESWIKEDDNDKSSKYGYGDLPIGTWFVAMKCAKTPQGDKVWEMVKSGELAGYSVSGWFEEIAAFCREEMFLQKVVEILKKY
jgi:hypothetical protein